MKRGRKPACPPKPKELTFLSLFSGFGGMDLGLERAGMRCVGQVEINPRCREELNARWPHVWRHDDVRTLARRIADCDREDEDGVRCPIHDEDFGDCACVGTDQLIDTVGPIDVIAAGSPCQDISKAGLGGGLDGARSGLYFEFIRVVREVGPRYIILENVPTLLGRGIHRVLGDLASSGYDAEWFVLPASFCGAPHTRARLFIVAYPVGERLEAIIAGRRFHDQPRPHRWVIAGSAYPCGGSWSTEPPVCVLDDGVPNDMAAVEALGNAVVPDVAEFIGKAVIGASRA
jgi:DNA (cytosine-5)-methyltransferase 1